LAEPILRIPHEPHEPRPALGYAMVASAATLFAVNGVVSKVIEATGFSSQRLTEVRSTGAFLGLAAIVALTHRDAVRTNARELVLLVALGIGGLALVQWSYFFAIHRLPIGEALLVQYVAPLLVALWARFVYREAVRRRIWVALALSLSGLILIVRVWHVHKLDGLGLAASALACVSYAFYVLVAERGVARRDAISLSAWGFLFAALFWAAAALVELPGVVLPRRRVAARPPRLAAPPDLAARRVDGRPRHDRPVRPRRRRASPRQRHACGDRRDARARCRDPRRLGLARRDACTSPADRVYSDADRDRAGTNLALAPPFGGLTPLLGEAKQLYVFKLARLFMKNKLLVTFIAGFLLVLFAAPAGAQGLSTSESSLLAAINGTRTGRGLAPVRVDVRLVRVARSHSTDMLRRNYFSHGSFSTRIRASGARGPMFGEDLAWGTAATPQWIIGQWLASPSHRAVLLRPGFRRVGIGIVTGTFHGYGGATVVTADFAGT
jgi:drug/metabolite transporter (DMT)-like permease